MGGVGDHRGAVVPVLVFALVSGYAQVLGLGLCVCPTASE